MAGLDEEGEWEPLREAIQRLYRRVEALEKQVGESQPTSSVSLSSSSSSAPSVPASSSVPSPRPAPLLPAQPKPAFIGPKPAPPKISLPPLRKQPVELTDWSALLSKAKQRFLGFDAPSEKKSPQKRKTTEPEISWEKFVGGQGLTWLGAASLALAVAYFLPWAWKHFELPAWLRVLVFHMAGGGLLVGAWSLKKKKLPVLAHGLAGLGIFTLYASAFAMEHQYHLWGELGSVITLLDCAIVTGLAIAIAVRYDSVYIILLGALGGYVTPLISAQGVTAFSATFSYLAFLNIALVATTLIRPWDFLKPLGVAATAIMFLIWIFNNQFDSWQTEWMLALHATLFLVGTTLPPLLWKKRSTSFDLAALGSNSLWFVGATWLLFRDWPEQQMAMVCWGMSALHAVLFAWTYHRMTNVDRMPRWHLALAAVFFTLAVPLQMRDTLNYLAYAWAIEGFVFAAVGVYFRDRQLTNTAGAVLVLALARAVGFDFMDSPDLLGTSGIDRRLLVMLGTGLATMAAGSCYWWVARMAPPRDAPARPQTEGALLLGLGNVVAMLGLTCQWDSRLVLVLWTLDAAMLWLVALRSDISAARIYALLVSVLMVGGRALYHGNHFEQPFWLLANERFGSLLLVAMLYFIPGWLLHKKNVASKVEAGVDAMLHLLGHLVLLVAISMEIHSYYVAGIFDRRSISLAEPTAYSIVWAIYAALLVAVGFVLRYRFARLLGLLGFLAVAMKVFFYDLATLPLIARVLALAVLGALLLVTSFWYQKYTSRLDSDR